MKVSELIELLRQQDPEALVVVDGYEAGLDDDVSVVARMIALNAHKDKWYLGRHDTATDKTPAAAQVPGVWLKGNRRRNPD